MSNVEKQFIANLSDNTITSVMPHDMLKGEVKRLGFQVSLTNASSQWCLEKYYAYIASGTEDDSGKPDRAQFETNEFSRYIQPDNFEQYPTIEAYYKCEDHYFLVKQYCWVAYVSFIANNEKNYLKYYATYDIKNNHGVMFHATFISESQYRAEYMLGQVCAGEFKTRALLNELYTKDKELVCQMMTEKSLAVDLPFDRTAEEGKALIEHLGQLSGPVTLQSFKQDEVNLPYNMQK